MMSIARTASYLAIGTSILTILAVCIYLPNLWAKIQAINDQVRLDGSEFRVLVDDAWKDMMIARSHQAPRDPTAPRKKRQYGATCRKCSFSIM